MKRNVPQLACGRDVEGVTSSCAALSRPQKRKREPRLPSFNASWRISGDQTCSALRRLASVPIRPNPTNIKA